MKLLSTTALLLSYAEAAKISQGLGVDTLRGPYDVRAIELEEEGLREPYDTRTIEMEEEYPRVPVDASNIEIEENQETEAEDHDQMDERAMEILQQYASFANYTDAYEKGKAALKNHFTIMGKHELNESRAALDDLYEHNE